MKLISYWVYEVDLLLGLVDPMRGLWRKRKAAWFLSFDEIDIAAGCWVPALASKNTAIRRPSDVTTFSSGDCREKYVEYENEFNDTKR